MVLNLCTHKCLVPPQPQLSSSAYENLVLPQGLDLRRCPVGRELEHKNGLIPSFAPVGGRWGMTLIGA